MELTSKAFLHGAKIPRKYTCQGENILPPLEIHGAPAETKSLALIMEDPDVPLSIRKDQMWNHCVVFNIDPKVTHIQENDSSFGTFGKNTSGEDKYDGPCPPDREHRYYFKLFALDAKLPILKGCSKKELESAMQGHILAQAELMGTYEKS